MADIYIGIAIVFMVSTAFFYCALVIAGKYSRKISTIIAGCLLLLLIFSIITAPHNWLVNLLPLSNVIIFANLIVPFTALLSGTVWRLISGKLYRKLLFMIPLVFIAFYSSYGFLFRPVPTSGNNWKDDVCLQSSESSCSAACAATLLKHYGIAASEKELIELCLTRDNGTMLLGTYRGLKLKTKQTQYVVKIEKWNLDKLLNSKFPVIIQAELKRWSNADKRYAGQWGWTPGVSHAVIFLGKGEGDKVIIADPSIGREQWRVEGIKTLWHGRVIYLSKK
jgi:predicted double-glycine peptidase